MTNKEYNERYFNAYFNCVTNPEAVEETQKKIYLNAFRQAIVVIISRNDIDLIEVKRQIALAVTRAYTTGLITADDAQALLRYRQLAIQYLRKGVKDVWD